VELEAMNFEEFVRNIRKNHDQKLAAGTGKKKQGAGLPTKDGSGLPAREGLIFFRKVLDIVMFNISKGCYTKYVAIYRVFARTSLL
jgi:hypothetical protein